MSLISILHLEDSLLDAELVCRSLRKDGLEFDYVRVDGRDAFEKALHGGPPSLILADHSLPGFDGVSALDISRRVCPDTPFLFVSGVMGEEVAIHMLQRGATDYVLKQRLDRLAPAVRRALSESEARAERLRAELQLRKSEQIHRLIFDSVRDYAIMTMDIDGHLTSWNSGAAAVLGYEEGEVLGQTHQFLFTPEDIAANRPHLELLRAGRPGRGDDERWYVRKDGTRIWGGGLVMPLVDDDGQVKGFTKVIRDMTERKQNEEALREADRRKDEFLAMLAHELRNPLSAIHNASQLAVRSGLPPERVAWTSDVIIRQVGHLSRLVDDLLDVSRITRGKIRLRPERVDLATLARRAVDTTRHAIDERNQTLTVQMNGGPFEVSVDPTRIEQVFVNLLSNASKYTQAGGWIDLTIETVGGRHRVRVRDNGIGIDREMLPRIFDLFSQVDQSLDRSQGGLGVGLTIVQKLVELHGGEVTATSPGRDQGTEFTVYLPALVVPPPAPTNGSTSTGSTPTRRGSSVLVVDDNLDTANALSELLQMSGYQVRAAHDGLEALNLARSLRPQIVLLDIGLPGMDGYQVAENLRRSDDFKTVYIVAITGYGEEQARIRAKQAGFNEHLVKPVDYDRLLSLLERRDALPI